jgi:ABC-type molybdate transport system substrate-binding protein
LITLIVAAAMGLVLWAPWNDADVADRGQLLLYCAAGIAEPVRAVAEDYHREYGIRVQLDLDASGKLLTKIRATPDRGDLFLAGDPSYVEKAREFGLVAESIPVARIRPVIIVHGPTQEKLRSSGKPIAAIDDLLRDEVSVVLANPEAASVGQLTRDLFKRTGHWDKLEARMRDASAPNVSTVGTVSEVGQTVRLRAGSVGIVWDATAAQLDGVDVVRVKALDEAVQEVTIGVLTSAKGSRATAALQFARYLTSRNRGQKRFAEAQYETIPDADLWAARPVVNLMSGAMLKPGIEETLKEFQAREGVTINTTYNGCGILVAQMKSMRQRTRSDQFPDAYFSCDVSFIEMVDQWFEASKLISENEMVFIVQKGNPRGIKTLEDLANREIKVGLGHPENSALGALTDLLLKRAGLHERVYADAWQEHIVHSDAGHDLVNKARTGAIDVAVVYRSNANATPENVEKHLDIVEIGAADAVARQPLAIAADSNHKYLMRRLVAALVSSQSADRFRALGFRWVYSPSHDE